jgi:hypothetical protein
MTGHHLHLTLLGAHNLDDGPPMIARSALTWKVERGDGQFAGASGLIASNLVPGDAGEVTNSHLGVIFLAAQRRSTFTPARRNWEEGGPR